MSKVTIKTSKKNLLATEIRSCLTAAIATSNRQEKKAIKFYTDRIDFLLIQLKEEL